MSTTPPVIGPSPSMGEALIWSSTPAPRLVRSGTSAACTRSPRKARLSIEAIGTLPWVRGEG
jgi:hypothetical protein